MYMYIVSIRIYGRLMYILGLVHLCAGSHLPLIGLFFDTCAGLRSVVAQMRSEMATVSQKSIT